MARETKIGIALMVLLVGVFGAMVYKKWNGRKPAAVAAAAVAEAEPDSKSASDDDPFAPTPAAIAPTPAGMEPTPVAMEPTPAVDPASSNPFDSGEMAPPVAQTEPGDPFAEPGFVRSEPSTADAGDTSMQPVAEAPPSQEEPADLAESPFAADENVAAGNQPTPIMSKTAPAAADDATAAVDVVPAGADAEDPFADPVMTQPMPGSAPSSEQPVAAEDPFSDAPAAASTTAATDTPMTATLEADAVTESVESAPATIAVDALDTSDSPEAPATAGDDPFAEPESVAAGAAEMTPAPETAAAEPAAAEDDPFSEPMTSTAAAEATPGRFPEGAAVPVGDRGAATAMQETPFDAAEPSPQPMPSTRSGQLDHYVVAENDSYWTISKRVYGTPIYFHALARFNAERVPNPERLKPGMTILTPPPQELSTRFPKLVTQGATAESTRDAASAEAGFLIDDGGRPSYRVGKDDTLTAIAQSHLGRASRWVQIYEMNRAIVPDPKSLKPGSVLRLPADASRVRLVPEG